MRSFALLAAFVVLASCSVSGEISLGSQTPEDASEDLIEGALAEQIGLGDLTASCSSPPSEDIGARFLCTGVTEDGRTVEFQAVMEEDGPFVSTTNIVLAENLQPIMDNIVAEIENQSGVDLADDALDCGTETLLVEVSNQVVCPLTDPTGEVFDTLITFNGLDTDDPTFDFVVDTGG